MILSSNNNYAMMEREVRDADFSQTMLKRLKVKPLAGLIYRLCASYWFQRTLRAAGRGRRGNIGPGNAMARVKAEGESFRN